VHKKTKTDAHFPHPPENKEYAVERKALEYEFSGGEPDGWSKRGIGDGELQGLKYLPFIKGCLSPREKILWRG